MCHQPQECLIFKRTPRREWYSTEEMNHQGWNLLRLERDVSEAGRTLKTVRKEGVGRTWLVVCLEGDFYSCVSLFLLKGYHESRYQWILHLSGHCFVTHILYCKCDVLEGRLSCCGFWFGLVYLVIGQIHLHGWGAKQFQLLSSVWAFSWLIKYIFLKTTSIFDRCTCYGIISWTYQGNGTDK